MPTALLVYPNNSVYGGGELVAAWMLQALAANYDLTVVAPAPPDVDALNRWYGTSISASDFELVMPPRVVLAPMQFALMRMSSRHALQQFALLMRMTKRIAHRFDVVVSSFNQADLGRPGIQYVHDHNLPPELYAVLRASNDARSRLRAAYKVHLRPWKLLSGFSYDRMRSNLTLVNSNWTGREMQRAYGIETVTLYPPAPGPFVTRPWESRVDNVVCVSRLDPNKRIERAIEIVSLARDQGQDLTLDLVGFTHADQGDYPEALRRRVRKGGTWIRLLENLPRDELRELLGRSRYGIHTMPNEPFGIAVAEMVRAGCVPFVPDSGGQVEITDHPRLEFHSTQEGAERLLGVARSPDLQTELRAHLAARADTFTAKRFVDAFSAIVRGRIAGEQDDVGLPADAVAAGEEPLELRNGARRQGPGLVDVPDVDV